MWQRYNQTSKIFEKSVDNGVSWAPLPLSASIITEGTIPNVAYVNQANNFSVTQILSHVGPVIMFNDTSQSANNKKIRLINSGTYFYIQSANDAETAFPGYVRFSRAGDIVASGVLSATGASLTGDLNVVSSANISRVGVNWPGGQTARLQVSSADSGEFLTNMYYAGTGWTGDIPANPGWMLSFNTTLDKLSIFRGSGPAPRTLTELIKVDNTGRIYERARTTAMGEWISYSASVTPNAGTCSLIGSSSNFQYVLIGKMMIFQISITGMTITGNPTELFVTIPYIATGMTANNKNPTTVSYFNGTAWTAILAYGSNGEGFVRVNCPGFTTGTNNQHIWGTFIVHIA